MSTTHDRPGSPHPAKSRRFLETLLALPAQTSRQCQGPPPLPVGGGPGSWGSVHPLPGLSESLLTTMHAPGAGAHFSHADTEGDRHCEAMSSGKRARTGEHESYSALIAGEDDTPSHHNPFRRSGPGFDDFFNPALIHARQAYFAQLVSAMQNGARAARASCRPS
jgi:hypothetical protein